MASGSGASFKHRWQYMNQLEFLQPHVIARPYVFNNLHIFYFKSSIKIIQLLNRVRSTTNILEQSSHASNKGSDAFQQPSPYCSTESINVDTYFSDVQYIDTQFLETETEASTSPATTAKPLKQKSKKRCGTFDDTDQIFADAVETFKKFCQSKEEREMQKENNRIHAFSKMVCATLQTLSENKQTRGIQQITDVLTKLKLEPE